MIVGICVELLWIFHWQSALVLLLGFRLGLMPCVVLGLIIVFSYAIYANVKCLY